ncbi:hypothetical protein D3C77_447150 [compost metagenome]
MFTEEKGQLAGLQCFFKWLEAVAVLNVDHIPVFLQQLLETMPKVRRQAIDTGAHGIAGVDRCQQVQWAVQWPPGQHDQAFEQRLERLACCLAGRDLGLHQ